MIKLENVLKQHKKLGDPIDTIGIANKPVGCRLPMPAIEFINKNNIHPRLLMIEALKQLGYKE